MFDKIGQIAGLLKNLPKLKEEMEKFQQKLGDLVAEGNAGAGLVQARVNGRFEVVQCTLSEEALKMNDREMLEDLIVAAINQALAKVRELVAAESGKMAGAMGLPGGLQFPGLG